MAELKEEWRRIRKLEKQLKEQNAVLEELQNENNLIRKANEDLKLCCSPEFIAMINHFEAEREARDLMPKRAFVIGTSPSIERIDLHQFDDDFTIGVNVLPLKYKTKALCITDYDLLKKKEIQEMLDDFDGPIYTTSIVKERMMISGIDILNMRFFKWKKPVYFTDDPYDGFGDGNSVCVFACQVALSLGFKPVYLLGSEYDYSGKTHYFSEGEDKICEIFDNNWGASGFDGHHGRIRKAFMCFRIATEKGYPVYSCMPGAGINRILPFKPKVVKYEKRKK